MSIITQDMRYRQFLLGFIFQHGISKASRKYNKVQSYIYFWLKLYNGSVESFAYPSRRPHSHPNQHSEEEIKPLRDMYLGNPELGRVESSCRLKKRLAINLTDRHI